MTSDWLKIPCDSLNTEPRRGAEVWWSFRSPELQYAERLLWDFLPDETKNKLPTPTLKCSNLHYLMIDYKGKSLEP